LAKGLFPLCLGVGQITGPFTAGRRRASTLKGLPEETVASLPNTREVIVETIGKMLPRVYCAGSTIPVKSVPSLYE
jgi:hypothetical protein